MNVWSSAPNEPRAQRPTDGILVILATIGLGIIVQARVGGGSTARALTSLLVGWTFLHHVWWTVLVLTTVGAIALFVLALAARRWLLCRDLALGAVAAGLLMVLLYHLFIGSPSAHRTVASRRLAAVSLRPSGAGHNRLRDCVSVHRTTVSIRDTRRADGAGAGLARVGRNESERSPRRIVRRLDRCGRRAPAVRITGWSAERGTRIGRPGCARRASERARTGNAARRRRSAARWDISGWTDRRQCVRA